MLGSRLRGMRGLFLSSLARFSFASFGCGGCVLGWCGLVVVGTWALTLPHTVSFVELFLSKSLPFFSYPLFISFLFLSTPLYTQFT